MIAVRRLCACLLSIVALLAVASGGALAAGPPEKATNTTQSALTVSPAIMEEILTPGEAVDFTLQVQNVTNFPLPIKSFVRDLTLQSEAESLDKNAKERLDASQWFTIAEPDFILQPNQVRTVRGVLRAPANATPGGHYATLYFQPLVPAEALSPSMAYINSRIGVLAFLVVSGDVEQKASLARAVETPGLVRQGPLVFRFAVKNTGNVHVVPGGALVIHDGRGKQAAKLDIPAGIVLPGSTKEYTLEWNPPGFIGKYSAELSLTYGAEHSKLPTTRATVWLLPWVELLIGAVLLLIIWTILRRTRRRWRKAWRVYQGHRR